LREAAHLPLEIAARTHEFRNARRADVGSVNLDERVDEVEPEPTLRLLGLEPGRKRVGYHVAFEEVHDVERDPEHALVLAHGADRRQPYPMWCECELEPCLAHHVVRRRRKRRPRRPAQDESAFVPLQEKREV